MKKKIHFYVNRKSVLTWLMTVCLVCSVVARIVIAGLKGSGDSLHLWGQIILPIVATLLYLYITLVHGNERFYKTAIPIAMISIYLGISIANNYNFDNLFLFLFYLGLFFFFITYLEITSGRWYLVLLFPLILCPLGTILYLHRADLLARDWDKIMYIMPDTLLFVGMFVLTFAVKMHPYGEHHMTWGDRPDGRRLRSQSPIDQVSPYLMVHRNESSNLFAESFEVTNVDKYIRQKRREGYSNFGIYHVLLAAYCRGIAKYPALNRFISGQKVYSRGNDIQFCMTIKKDMNVDSPDTVIKVHLTPYDTAIDVYNKINAEVEKVKNTPLDSTFDNTAHVLMTIPGIFLKFIVWLLRTLDYFGMIPKFLLEISPFHGSVYFTSLGSLGISPVYHHLYNFGNMPAFLAFGCKRREFELQEDGTIEKKKYIDFKVTCDERIVDGFYYATFFKYYKRLIAHPELLDIPPEEVVRDID